MGEGESGGLPLSEVCLALPCKGPAWQQPPLWKTQPCEMGRACGAGNSPPALSFFTLLLYLNLGFYPPFSFDFLLSTGCCKLT